MPPVNKPPISLNEGELLALVAFLQSLGGTVIVSREDIVHLHEVKETTAGTPSPATSSVLGDTEKGATVFQKYCSVCHVVRGEGGMAGPDLSAIGGKHDEGYIRESILNPGASITAGYQPIMPVIFAEQLTVKEFNDLLVYLMSLKGE